MLSLDSDTIQMLDELLTKEKVLNWLRNQMTNKTLDMNDFYDCLFAQYLKANLDTEQYFSIRVNIDYITFNRTFYYNCPSWVIDFQELLLEQFNDEDTNICNVTVYEIIRLLEQVDA